MSAPTISFTIPLTTPAEINDQRERVLNAASSAMDLAETMRGMGDEASAQDLLAEARTWLAESKRLRAIVL